MSGNTFAIVLCTFALHFFFGLICVGVQLSLQQIQINWPNIIMSRVSINSKISNKKCCCLKFKWKFLHVFGVVEEKFVFIRNEIIWSKLVTLNFEEKKTQNGIEFFELARSLIHNIWYVQKKAGITGRVLCDFQWKLCHTHSTFSILSITNTNHAKHLPLPIFKM